MDDKSMNEEMSSNLLRTAPFSLRFKQTQRANNFDRQQQNIQVKLLQPLLEPRKSKSENTVDALLIPQPDEDGNTSNFKLAVIEDIEKSFSGVPDHDHYRKKVVSCDLAASGAIGHWNVTDQGTEYICDMDDGKCKRSFTTLSYLKKHQHLHTNSKKLVCTYPDCGRRFTLPHHLRYHINSHKAIKDFSCGIAGCSASFCTSQQRKVHMRTHTGDKPFTCDVCQKKFLTLQNLQNHGRTHTGEKPFVCTFTGCTRSFAEKSSLKKHTVTHTGEKPHKCKFCQKGFTQASTLNFHIMRYHTENPPLSRSIANIQAQQKAAAEAQAQQLHFICNEGMVLQSTDVVICTEQVIGTETQTSTTEGINLLSSQAGAQDTTPLISMNLDNPGANVVVLSPQVITVGTVHQDKVKVEKTNIVDNAQNDCNIYEDGEFPIESILLTADSGQENGESYVINDDDNNSSSFNHEAVEGNEIYVEMQYECQENDYNIYAD